MWSVYSMIGKVPDYENCNREELHDVLDNIDREKYPESVKLAEDALKKLPPLETAEKENRDKKDRAIFVIASVEVLFWLILVALALAGFSIF